MINDVHIGCAHSTGTAIEQIRELIKGLQEETTQNKGIILVNTFTPVQRISTANGENS